MGCLPTPPPLALLSFLSNPPPFLHTPTLPQPSLYRPLGLWLPLVRLWSCSPKRLGLSCRSGVVGSSRSPALCCGQTAAVAWQVERASLREVSPVVETEGDETAESGRKLGSLCSPGLAEEAHVYPLSPRQTLRHVGHKALLESAVLHRALIWTAVMRFL